jgi:uncharacterized protein YoxC
MKSTISLILVLTVSPTCLAQDDDDLSIVLRARGLQREVQNLKRDAADLTARAEKVITRMPKTHALTEKIKMAVDEVKSSVGNIDKEVREASGLYAASEQARAQSKLKEATLLKAKSDAAEKRVYGMNRTSRSLSLRILKYYVEAAEERFAREIKGMDENKA